MDRYVLVQIDGTERLVGPFHEQNAVTAFEHKLKGSIERLRDWEPIAPAELERELAAVSG